MVDAAFIGKRRAMKGRLTTQFVFFVFGLLTACEKSNLDKANSGPHASGAATRHGGSAQPAHWGYEGVDGPEYWPTLNPAYAICGQGTSQSPINITRTTVGDGNGWKLNYKTSSLRIAHNEHVDDIIDNGHTIQVTVDQGSTLTTDRGSYQLKQFHYHTPSEHTIDGTQMPMEAHFVHQSADGRLAVLSVLYQEGSENENLAKIIAHFPKAKGESSILPEVKLELRFHLPENIAAYHYMGSLTTPPCTENVEWIVFRDPINASREQLAAFAARLGRTNRPVQPLNGRLLRMRQMAGQVGQ